MRICVRIGGCRVFVAASGCETGRSSGPDIAGKLVEALQRRTIVDGRPEHDIVQLHVTLGP